MRILNPLSMLAFLSTRIVLRFVWVIYGFTGGLLRVLWIPVKAALYVIGAAVGLGVVAGLIVLATHGGHLHGSPPNSPPVRVFGK